MDCQYEAYLEGGIIEKEEEAPQQTTAATTSKLYRQKRIGTVEQGDFFTCGLEPGSIFP